MNNELILKVLELALNEGGAPKESPAKSNSIYSDSIGEKVIVRSRNEGINFGTVVNADETGILLSSCRRVWYHKPADSKTAWYEGVAVSGLHSDSKISCVVHKKLIAEEYSITFCSDVAIKSIEAHKSHES